MGSTSGDNQPTVAAGDLVRVYDLAAEFGAARATTLESKVFDQLPHLNEGQVASAIAYVARFEGRAFDLACEVWDKDRPQDAARAQLAREYPVLASRSARAMGQAMFFACK